MKAKLNKLWAMLGVTGVIAVILGSALIYMNVRSADPILPGWEEYSPARFEELMASGEPVMVEIYASWCPTCLLQHRAFEELHETGRAPEIRAVRVDFDRDTDFIQEHGYQGTGMLVVFKGGREVAREAGLVSGDKILGFLQANGIS